MRQKILNRLLFFVALFIVATFYQSNAQLYVRSVANTDDCLSWTKEMSLKAQRVNDNIQKFRIAGGRERNALESIWKGIRDRALFELKVRSDRPFYVIAQDHTFEATIYLQKALGVLENGTEKVFKEGNKYYSETVERLENVKQYAAQIEAMKLSVVNKTMERDALIAYRNLGRLKRDQRNLVLSIPQVKIINNEWVYGFESMTYAGTSAYSNIPSVIKFVPLWSRKGKLNKEINGLMTKMKDRSYRHIIELKELENLKQVSEILKSRNNNNDYDDEALALLQEINELYENIDEGIFKPFLRAPVSSWDRLRNRQLFVEAIHIFANDIPLIAEQLNITNKLRNRWLIFKKNLTKADRDALVERQEEIKDLMKWFKEQPEELRNTLGFKNFEYLEKVTTSAKYSRALNRLWQFMRIAAPVTAIGGSSAAGGFWLFVQWFYADEHKKNECASLIVGDSEEDSDTEAFYNCIGDYVEARFPLSNLTPNQIQGYYNKTYTITNLDVLRELDDITARAEEAYKQLKRQQKLKQGQRKYLAGINKLDRPTYEMFLIEIEREEDFKDALFDASGQKESYLNLIYVELLELDRKSREMVDNYIERHDREDLRNSIRDFFKTERDADFDLLLNNIDRIMKNRAIYKVNLQKRKENLIALENFLSQEAPLNAP